MKFKYKELGSGIRRPVIPVTIEHEGRKVTYEALIDSGADISIFDTELGELLGINVESGLLQQVSGVGGGSTEPIYLHEVTVRIGEYAFSSAVAFKQNFSRFDHGVLGHRGFFEQFAVKFDMRKDEIEINGYIEV